MKTNICVAVYFHFSSVKIYSGGTGLHVKGMFNLIQNFQTPFQVYCFTLTLIIRWTLAVSQLLSMATSLLSQ